MPHKRRLLLIIPAILGMGLLVLALVWDWNWLRPLVEHRASVALGRKVTLHKFDVKVGRYPMLVADDVTVTNPPEFPAGTQLGSIDRVSVRIDLWRLAHRQLHLLEINAEHPRGDLRPGPNGKRNWEFDLASKGGPGSPVEIGSLNIIDGNIQFFDPQFKADFTMAMHTESAKNGTDSRLLIDAEGTYADQPIKAHFVGGSVLTLRDPGHPYPVDLEVENGPTVITLKGTIERPLQLGGADLDLHLKGNNLAALYPLTGVPLPPSAPYTLKGKLEYSGERVRFMDFAGVVGKSDLEGNLDIDLTRKKRLITAILHSNSVEMTDLSGFTGAKPRNPTPKDNWHILPDEPINLPRIRAADLDIQYKVTRFKNKKLPLDNLAAHIIVQDGLLSMSPVSFGVGEGRIVAHIELDGRKDLVHTVADVDFRRIDLKRLLLASKLVKGTGLIGGAASIDSTGNSTAKMLANGNGELHLFMNEGDLSALLVDLAGLEFGKALLSALGMPSRTDIRCAVSDLELKEGILRPRLLLADTKEANIFGEGLINLQNETLDLRIRTEPKRPGIVSLRGPVVVRGALKKPTIAPEMRPLVTRGAAAVALGALLTPLAALLPTIELGLGKDNNCAALVSAIKSDEKARPLANTASN
jgi:AsmA family protein